MTITPDQLRAAPFNLSDERLAWVLRTFAALSLDEKLGQIVLPLCRDLTEPALDAVLAHGVGGIHRMPTRTEHELRTSAVYAQSKSGIPLLMTCDTEFSEKSSVAAGTPFPNQMAVAATRNPDHARAMGALAAREGGYLGFNISWTPVADLALNHRSNVVNTRAFGADTELTSAFVRAYADGAHAAGYAKCIKHWPGDGLDDRDQHFATTHNTLDMASWRESFGRIYDEAIAGGTQIVMAGHITLPAYSGELGAKAKSPATMPASLNADLLRGLLRRELGFNGVIVSDASGMVGFNARGPRSELVPMCIENGCDILLFPDDLEEDLNYLRTGIETGALSKERLDDAVLRVLALKASLGLSDRPAVPPESERAERLGSAANQALARTVCEDAVTLVKDTQNLLPLSPDRHKRILLAQLKTRMSPSGPLPELQIKALLETKGFEVTLFEPGSEIDAEGHDIGLYVMAEEGVSAKENLGPRWEDLHGLFPRSMDRLWDKLPTLYISLGTPFLLYHMPECRTFINAYSAIPEMQRAVVRAVTGEIPFRGSSPVDALCGLEEARL